MDEERRSIAPRSSRETREGADGSGASTTLPSALLSLLVLASGPVALGAPCAVPGDHPDLSAALADPNCDPIELGSGTYRASLTVDRNVTLTGDGSSATTLLGIPDLEVLSVAGSASVQLEGLKLLVHPDTDFPANALGKEPGASVGMSDVGIGISPPLPQPAPLDDAIALWNFANGVDSLGGESTFGAGGDFGVGEPVSLPDDFAFNADGLVAREGPVEDCNDARGILNTFPDHELAVAAGGSLTMWARLRFPSFDGKDDIFRYDVSYILELVDGRPVFRVLGASQPDFDSVVHGTTLATDAWMDVAGVFDAGAGELRLFVHDPTTGASVGSPASASVPFSSLHVGGAPLTLLFLHAFSNINGCNVGAELEMAAVWNRVLSEPEIRNLSCGPGCGVFADGFESGDTSRW